MALAVGGDREWIIRNAKGRRFVYESAEEAFEELHECREGAIVLTREVYRGMFRAKPVTAWQEVALPAPAPEVEC